MKLQQLLDDLARKDALLSLLGDEETLGHLHVIGVRLTRSEVELMRRHRELLSTILVQVYRSFGHVEVEASVIHSCVRRFQSWLASQDCDDFASLDTGGRMADLAMAMVQDAGEYRVTFGELTSTLEDTVSRAA